MDPCIVTPILVLLLVALGYYSEDQQSDDHPSTYTQLQKQGEWIP